MEHKLVKSEPDEDNNNALEVWFSMYIEKYRKKESCSFFCSSYLLLLPSKLMHRFHKIDDCVWTKGISHWKERTHKLVYKSNCKTFHGLSVDEIILVTFQSL